MKRIFAQIGVVIWTILGGLTAHAQPTTLFFDDFSGPTLSAMWQADLPDAYCGSFPNGYASPALYQGAPNFSFQTVGTNSVIRLTNTLAPLQRVGWGSATNFIASDFRYEVRFNTLVQSSATSIDGFIEIWIINATNSSLYDIISPFGGWYDAAPYFFVGSTIDSSYTQTPISYSNNTWYRLVLQGAPGQNIRASMLTDDGTELIGATLSHGAAAYGSGFQIALSQVIGGAGSPYPVDVAVDYVKLTSGFAPVITSQPASQAVGTGNNVSFSVGVSGSMPLSYQWSYAGTAITDATNATLVLTNVQPAQSGNYTVTVANPYGTAFSSNAVLICGSAPGITTQPVSQTVAVGGTATMSVAATGALPIAYQWEYSGVPLVGATNAMLQLTNVQYSESGNYSVVLDNVFGYLTSSNATLTVQTPPFMTSQPSSETVFLGQTAIFTAAADGSQPLAYLWSWNGTNLPWATNNTLVLTNAQFSQAGVYVLTVTNAFGGVWSSNAVLTVNGVSPFVINPPASQAATIGGTATFSVLAGGTGPLSYQWALNGTGIVGATNSTLTLANVQYAQAGPYAVTITSPYGSVTSSSALLTVISPLATAFFDDFSGPTLNPIWQTNLPQNAYCGSFPGYAQTAYYLGAPNFGFQLLSSSSVLRLTNQLPQLNRRGWSSLTNFGGTNFYFEARYNTLNQSSTSSIDGFIEIWVIDAANSNRYDIVSPFGGNYDGGKYFFAGSTIDNTTFHPSFTYSNNTWYRLVLQSAPGANIRASIYNDTGTELIGQTFAHNGGAFPNGFKIGLSQAVGMAGGTYPVDVAVDHVLLSTAYAPFITSQPTNEAVVAGGTASFNVGVTGLSPFSYQWTFDGTNIANATNATLTLSNVQLANVGNYAVAITNSTGATNSGTASLTLISPIIITQQPQSVSALNASSVGFTVAATGTGPLSYQWRKDGSNLTDGGNISGSATTTLQLLSVSTNDAGNYDVVITSPYETTNSAPAALSIAETVLSLGSTNAISGSTVEVPVWLNALGTENAVETSVAYDPTKLVLLSISGANLYPVLNETNNGYIGFASVLSPGTTFPAGSNVIASLVFQTVAVTNNTTVSLSFGDVPETRIVVAETLDGFTALPAVYSGGSVTLLPTASLPPVEYEADVYPRTNGDGTVNIFDWLEVGRMVAGLDVPTNSDEFLRADCAPRNAPDGMLTVADWVQAGRYALGLDPLTPVLTTPASPEIAKNRVVKNAGQNGASSSGPILQVATISGQRGQTVTVPVSLVCSTNENAVGMTISYPTNSLKFKSVNLAAGLANATLYVNSNQIGHIGIALALSPGTSLPPGTNLLVTLQFTTSAKMSGSIPLTLENTLVHLQVADNTANSLSTTYVGGAVILPPQPQLAVGGTGPKTQLSWSLASGTFQVQVSSSPVGPWTNVFLSMATNAGNVSIMYAPTNQQQYFRLQGQ